MRRLFLLLFLLSIALAAQAQPLRRGAGAIRGPCGEDAAKLCKGVEPGGGRIIACLRGSDAKLSAGCKTQLAQMDARSKGRPGPGARPTGPRAGAPPAPAPAKPQ